MEEKAKFPVYPFLDVCMAYVRRLPKSSVARIAAAIHQR
jgi:hypothetical protein